MHMCILCAHDAELILRGSRASGDVRTDGVTGTGALYGLPHRSPRDALGAILAHLMDAGQCARASGATLMANHVMAAARSVAHANALLHKSEGSGAPPDADNRPTVQEIRLWCGEPTGLSLAADGGDSIGTRSATWPDGHAALPPAIAAHDLGWELLASPEGRALAADDVDAALLARALAQTCWIAQGRRSRWSTSTTGAATVVRLLRGGAPFPLLDPYGPLIDAKCAGLLAALGWRPALGAAAPPA